jgi:hypothetical protein
MTYALVIDNAIAAVGRLPKAARRLDTGQWISPHNGQWTVAEHEACGWFVVVDVARPADTGTNTTDRSITLVAGKPTVTWTSRLWTADELASRQAVANETTIDAYLNDALALIDTITARAAVPFTQQGVRDVQTDCKDLGRIMRRIIRKQLRKLDATT